MYQDEFLSPEITLVLVVQPLSMIITNPFNLLEIPNRDIITV